MKRIRMEPDRAEEFENRIGTKPDRVEEIEWIFLF